MADRYFVESPVTSDRAVLAGAEAHHLLHVMRAKTGTRVTLFDGSGWEFEAVVQRTGRSEVELAIAGRQEIDREAHIAVTLGVAPVLAGQRLAAYGLQPMEGFSTNPHYVTDNGYDYSFGGGVKVGALWEPDRQVTLGVSFQSPMWMQKLGKYKGLFADGGNFDIPPAITSGITVRPVDTVDLTVEHQAIFFSSVSTLGNSGNLSPFLPGSPAAWRLGAGH